MKKEIIIFICEDEEVGKEIITKYFNPEQITYTSIFSAEKREKIVEVLEKIED